LTFETCREAGDGLTIRKLRKLKPLLDSQLNKELEALNEKKEGDRETIAMIGQLAEELDKLDADAKSFLKLQEPAK
jgi:hypothetical protein